MGRVTDNHNWYTSVNCIIDEIVRVFALISAHLTEKILGLISGSGDRHMKTIRQEKVPARSINGFKFVF